MMNRVGIVGKPREGKVITLTKALVPWLEARGREPVVEEALVHAIQGFTGFPREEIPKRIDLLVVLGGDGTLLSAVRMISFIR